jgi:hypothetical protein
VDILIGLLQIVGVIVAWEVSLSLLVAARDREDAGAQNVGHGVGEGADELILDSPAKDQVHDYRDDQAPATIDFSFTLVMPLVFLEAQDELREFC